MTKQIDFKQDLLIKISNQKARIGVIGLGYVGLPLCMRLSEVFSSVIGFDTDSNKIKLLQANTSYIKQIPHCRIAIANRSGFEHSTDFSLSKSCDALILCIPTPLTKHHEPDLSFVRKTIESLQPYLREGQALSLESTTFPGTTDELIVPRIKALQLKPGQNFFVIYSPEREDPGNKQYSTKSIPKVVGGYTSNCLNVGTHLYRQIVDTVVPVSSTRAAEMTKLLENIHRAVNIGLVNELKIVTDKMGIDIHEIINAAATKPFGFTKYYPGPGLGGHCIPIDPFYLTWKAKEYDVNTRFIELSGEVNRAMPDWVVNKVGDALNNKGKAIKHAKILVLGIAYKKNVDDPRESPAIKIMEKLRDKGALITYSDPYIDKFPEMRDHSFNLSSITLNRKNLSEADLCLLTTDHDIFPYDQILQHANLIVDTQNRFDKSMAKVVPA